MTRLREVVWLLGRPDSISWPVFWSSLVAGTIGNFATNPQGLPGWLRLAALVCGQVALWAVLVFVRQTWLRDPLRSRPLVVIGAFFVGILFRVLIVAWLIFGAFGPEAVLLGERMVGAFLNIGPVMIATALGTSALRLRRSQIAQLAQTQEELRQTLNLVQQQISRSESEATARVQQLLVTKLDGLDHGDPAVSKDQLQSLARDVVRPLSHEFTGLVQDRIRTLPPTPAIRVSWSDMLDVDVIGRPFRPLVTGGILALQALGAILGVPGMPVSLLMVPLFVAVSLALANQIAEPMLRYRTRRQRVAAIMATLLAVSGLAGALVLALIGLMPPGPAFSIAAVFSTLLSLLITVVLITIQSRGLIAEELKHATEQLRRLLACQRQAQWFAERSLGRALHGPIQNSLLAAASRLELALSAESDPKGLLADLRDDLIRQVTELGAQYSPTFAFDKALARLEATWQGICVISVDRSHAELQLSIDDPVTLTCLQDIIVEFVSNSVRHGGATQVDIALMEVASPFGSDIQVHAKSNAGIVQSGGSKGLGTRMYDDWATEWSMSATPNSVEVQLTLPCTPTQEKHGKTLDRKAIGGS